MATAESALANWGESVTELLASGRRPGPSGGSPGLRGVRGLAIILVGGAIYGAVMATFCYEPSRWLQVLFGAVKIPMLFGITMLLAVPGFYVLNALRGLGDDFSKVFSMLIDYQILVVIVLVSLSPITALLSLTTGESGYGLIQLWNTLVFLAAAMLAQWKFGRSYRELIAANPAHRLLLRVWTLLYAFIGIQMGWTLRPFVGSPGSEVTFLRTADIDNAYVEIFNVFMRTFGM